MTGFPPNHGAEVVHITPYRDDVPAVGVGEKSWKWDDKKGDCGSATRLLPPA